MEEKLNRRIESHFGNLLNNKLLGAEGKIELKRDELYLIKKFLLVSVIRSMGNEEFMRVEKHYYDQLNEYGRNFARQRVLNENKIEALFVEKDIEGETPFDYWMRTIEGILDTNGTPQEILNHPNKTYSAHRWAEVINNGYVSFWDSEFIHDEFVITDIGMTSENPPTYIETAEYDCLHDEGILLFQKLTALGVACILYETKGTMHGYDICRKAPTTRSAIEKWISFLVQEEDSLT